MFARTSHAAVVQLLSEFPFAGVIKGPIQECATSLDRSIFHFVHLDVDLHAPMLWSLACFLPRLAIGGIICVDDYNKKSCPGVRLAVEEAITHVADSVIVFPTDTAQCLIVKTADRARLAGRPNPASTP